MDFGFSHCYHLHLSLFPWDTSSFRDRLDKAYRLMKKAGAVSFRPHVHWNRVEPVIVNPGIKPHEVTDAMVERYAKGKDGVFWEETDLMVNRMLAHGIRPFLCLGAAYLHQVPLAEHKGKFIRFEGNAIPDDVYMGHLYLHARAVVRRYRGKCTHWQLENELNESGPTELIFRWREGRRWYSGSFSRAIIELLHRAVKEEDPRSLTAHNYSMGFRRIPWLYSWKSAIKEWDRYIDIIGYDPFPNYLKGEPIKIADDVARRTKEVRDLGLNKPIYILEDGYPVAPAGKGFSEDNQRRYVQELLEASEKHGLDGVFIYCFVSQEGAPGNEWHKRLQLNDIEDWWGYFRADGTPRPAYEYLVQRASKRKSKAGRRR
jgi:hypothetical protein